MLSFFSWWYGAGWIGVVHSFGPRLQTTADTFSVSQLLRTLFAPWRRIITYPGASFQDKLRAWGDNLFSRTVGFVVRLLFLLVAGIAVLLTVVGTALELALWPLLPIAVPVLLILGVVA